MTVGLSGCHSSQSMDDQVIIPTPLAMEKTNGSFTFNAQTVIAVPSENEVGVANLFASLFTGAAGFTPEVKVGTEGNIVLEINDALKEDAYEMTVESSRITLKAADTKGFFYALQNLRLMLPAAIEGKTTSQADWTVPAMTVRDEPRFGYRGFMLDVARFFMPKEDVLRMIDCMAMLKLNRLHLHLSDDNGWRLEIKKYPRLTEVGAWRVDRPGIPFPARRNPTKDEKQP